MIRRFRDWALPLAIVGVILLAARGEGTWATPAQDPHRQSVPTRTPVPIPPPAGPPVEPSPEPGGDLVPTEPAAPVPSPEPSPPAPDAQPSPRPATFPAPSPTAFAPLPTPSSVPVTGEPSRPTSVPTPQTFSRPDPLSPLDGPLAPVLVPLILAAVLILGGIVWWTLNRRQ